MAQVDLTQAFTAIEVIGIATGALAGALDGKRRDDFDVFGVLGLAFAGGLGGGLLRDVLIGDTSPAAFTVPSYLPIVIAVAVVVSIFPGEPGTRAQLLMRPLEAISVAAFAIVAADRANFAGFTILGCLLLGVIGGVGGLFMRDIITASTPEIFRRGELNGIAALVGAAVFIALLKLEIERPIPAIAGITAGALLRLAAVQWDIRAPAPRRR